MKQFILAVVTIFSLASCGEYISGSGNIVKEQRSVKDFNKIKVGGAFTVNITIGSPQKVEVESDDNILPFIETTVNGTTLSLKTKSHTNFNNGHYVVNITVPSLEKIDASGAATVDCKNLNKREGSFKIESSGASTIKAEIDAPAVEVHSSGAGEIQISGRTKNYWLHSSGSSEIKSSGLLSETTDAKVSGAGNVHVHASVQLKAKASGAGTIYYRGAAQVDQDVSGAGTVKKED
jgi:Putative auto-transporter adhesin, head GIN domain